MTTDDRPPVTDEARAETTTDLHWSNAAAAEYPGDEYEQYPLRTAFGRGVKWERKRAEATTEDAAQATDSNPSHDRMERALRAVVEMHRPEPQEVSTIDGFARIVFCRECGLEWGDDGCPTAVKIEEALGSE